MMLGGVSLVAAEEVTGLLSHLTQILVSSKGFVIITVSQSELGQSNYFYPSKTVSEMGGVLVGTNYFPVDICQTVTSADH